MIKVNLLGDKVDYAVAIATHALVVSAVMFFVIAGCVMTYTSSRGAVVEAREERDDMKTELIKLKKVTAQVQDLEKNKTMLQEKLMTIAQLKAKKQGPVRILDSINMNLPEQAWLDSIKERGGFVEISGKALDNQTIAKYMGLLTNSDHIKSVDLVQSKQILKDEVPLKEFALRAELDTSLAVAARQQQLKEEMKESKEENLEELAEEAAGDDKAKQEMLKKLLNQIEKNESAS